MATSITCTLNRIKEELDSHLSPDDILAACGRAGHDWRERMLGPVLTVQALLLQVLHNTAMTGVGRLMEFGTWNSQGAQTRGTHDKFGGHTLYLRPFLAQIRGIHTLSPAFLGTNSGDTHFISGLSWSRTGILGVRSRLG